MVHLLRYLQDHSNVGIRFYSDYINAPMTKSWNDDINYGRSTGCFITTYLGGVVDHSSNLPDPVALSSAEAQ
jgi:hypothetical protein